MGEVDQLFDNLGSGVFAGADPNNIPQEGVIGQGTIQGQGFVQSGGAARAYCGGLPYGGTASPGTSLPMVDQYDTLLVPIPIPGLMEVTSFTLELGSAGASSAALYLCADLGQGAALTVIAKGTYAPGAGQAIDIREISLAATTITPPGNYWMLIQKVSSAATTVNLGYSASFLLSTGLGGIRSGSYSGSPAVGDLIVIDFTTFFSRDAFMPVGGLLGRVFGIATDF